MSISTCKNTPLFSLKKRKRNQFSKPRLSVCLCLPAQPSSSELSSGGFDPRPAQAFPRTQSPKIIQTASFVLTPINAPNSFSFKLFVTIPKFGMTMIVKQILWSHLFALAPPHPADGANLYLIWWPLVPVGASSYYISLSLWRGPFDL